MTSGIFRKLFDAAIPQNFFLLYKLNSSHLHAFWFSNSIVITCMLLNSTTQFHSQASCLIPKNFSSVSSVTLLLELSHVRLHSVSINWIITAKRNSCRKLLISLNTIRNTMQRIRLGTNFHVFVLRAKKKKIFEENLFDVSRAELHPDTKILLVHFIVFLLSSQSIFLDSKTQFQTTHFIFPRLIKWKTSCK